MTSWIRWWWLFFLPGVLLLFVGLAPTLLPDLQFGGKVIVGTFIRDAITLRLADGLPSHDGELLRMWLAQASSASRNGLYGLVSVNIAVAMSPIIWAVGSVWIRASNWITMADLDQKRKSAKRW